MGAMIHIHLPELVVSRIASITRRETRTTRSRETGSLLNEVRP